jgi:hypothetical protein
MKEEAAAAPAAPEEPVKERKRNYELKGGIGSPIRIPEN